MCTGDVMKIYSDNKDIQVTLTELTNELTDLSITTSIEQADITVSDDIEIKPDILISAGSDLDNITLIEKSNLLHIIGQGKSIKSELRVTLDKINTKKLGGIAKYLDPQTPIISKVFHHSKDISTQIEEMVGSIDYKNFFDSPKDYLRLILNELVTNSFFHQQELEHTDRKNSTFSLNNSIEAKLAIDNEKIIVSVSDSIGTITPFQVATSLTRGMREKSPTLDSSGAGLGLYMVYENTNQFIINKKSQQYSEFICIIDANKRFKKFKERVTSFHFFEEE